MATENMIKFYKGALANLPATGTNGALYITTDEGAIYLGTGVGMKRLGDFVQVDAVANLPASANTSALYYCVAENVLAKWNGTEWKQVNKQPTKDELKVMLGLDAAGDVTAAIATAKKAGDDAQADVNALTDYVGTFTHETAKTVVEYINAKTDGIATSGNLEALGQRVTAVEGDVATIKGDYLKAADKTELEGKITAAQTAADNAQSAVNALSETHGTDKAALEAAIALKGDASAVEAAQSKADSAYELAESKATMADVNDAIANAGHAVASEVESAIGGINEKIGEVAEGKTVVQMIEAAQEAATFDDTEVKGLISDNADAIEEIANDYLKAADKEELEGAIDAKVAQADYDTKVGELVAEDARLAGLIDTKADQTALDAEIERATQAEAGLQTQINTIMNNPDTEGVINSINEFTQYIADHGEIADGFRADIDALGAKVDTGDKTVSAYVEAEIAALNIGDYATVEALEDATDRISELETASATHATKDELKVVSDALDEYKTAHNADYDNDAVDDKVKAVQDQIDALDNTFATDDELATAIAGEVERANGLYATKDALGALETKHNEYEAAHVSDYTNAQIDEAIDADVKVVNDALEAHKVDAVVHITADERTAWNGAVSDLATHKAAYDEKIAALEAEDADIRVDFADADATLQGNIDTVSGALDTYKTENDAAVALKADASAVYTKEEIIEMFTWGEF